MLGIPICGNSWWPAELDAAMAIRPTQSEVPGLVLVWADIVENFLDQSCVNAAANLLEYVEEAHILLDTGQPVLAP